MNILEWSICILIGLVIICFGLIIYASFNERSIECHEGHFEERLKLIPAGKVLIPMQTKFFICDKM